MSRKRNEPQDVGVRELSAYPSIFIMPKRQQYKKDDLSRMLIYVLGHRPDEFGLVPDMNGYFPVKEILKALHEEPGWSYVMKGHINEVLIGKHREKFQSNGDKLKVPERRWTLDLDTPVLSPPKLLYIAVRKRAYPYIAEKGFQKIEGRLYVLSENKEMARRIGQRRDRKPILLEVQAFRSQSKGTNYYPFNNLFLAREIPPSFIIGPPLDKEMLKRKEEEEAIRQRDFQAGTFSLDLDRDRTRPIPQAGNYDGNRGKKAGKKRKGWKEDARKMRRRKSGQ